MLAVKWYKKPEMIVAFSALLISLITTAVSVYSAYIDRSYARASVWPRLEWGRSFGHEHFSYHVTNSGNGPALIQYAVVRYQSKPIKAWQDILSLPNAAQSHISTKILSPQEIVKPLSYEGSEMNTLLKIDESIDVELCYCSLYEECWIITREIASTAVDRCVVDPSIAFTQ
ncbi:hypothetical protein [uncultured Shewanella sp.]|uniref:hypothetical protein n=1 Tax=uncultured Shewanella sp. TaxID=173975 RepID=UPI0026065EA9|nr:hypothetical protein [uncultured Shewanella sp.]